MSLTGAPQAPPPKRRSPLEALLPYTSVAVIVAALWVVWTFYSRHEANIRAQREIEAKQEAARKRVVDQIYGSGEIRFTAFSADTGTLRRGDRTQLCYGVLNAKSVRIDPPVEAIKPSYQ